MLVTYNPHRESRKRTLEPVRAHSANNPISLSANRSSARHHGPLSPLHAIFCPQVLIMQGSADELGDLHRLTCADPATYPDARKKISVRSTRRAPEPLPHGHLLSDPSTESPASSESRTTADAGTH